MTTPPRLFVPVQDETLGRDKRDREWQKDRELLYTCWSLFECFCKRLTIFVFDKLVPKSENISQGIKREQKYLQTDGSKKVYRTGVLEESHIFSGAAVSIVAVTNRKDDTGRHTLYDWMKKTKCRTLHSQIIWQICITLERFSGKNVIWCYGKLLNKKITCLTLYFTLWMLFSWSRNVSFSAYFFMDPKLSNCCLKTV